MASNVKFRIVAVIVILTTLLGLYTERAWSGTYAPGFNFPFGTRRAASPQQYEHAHL